MSLHNRIGRLEIAASSLPSQVDKEALYRRQAVMSSPECRRAAGELYDLYSQAMEDHGLTGVDYVSVLDHMTTDQLHRVRHLTSTIEKHVALMRAENLGADP